MKAASTPGASCRGTARALLWAVAMHCVVVVAPSCKEQVKPKPPEAPAAAATPVSASAPAPARLREEHAIRLAVIRHLVTAQPPTPEGGIGYVAYLVKDDPDGLLAASLAEAFAGRTPPFRSADHTDFYVRKGRAMDAATGRPVKLFRAQVVELIETQDVAARGTGPTAVAVASWQGGRLTGESFRYRLRRDGSGWTVEGRTREGP